MTSEVLILNKRAVVVAADSAVTTSGGKQPRYSKSATKIFELSTRGNVAAAIYGSASIDLVPWELALKLYRKQLGDRAFPKVSDYLADLIAFLSGNGDLFPPDLRTSWSEQQFDNALVIVLEEAKRLQPGLVDPAVALVDRQTNWRAAANSIREMLKANGVSAGLPSAAQDAVIADAALWGPRAQAQIAISAPILDAVEASELAELGHRVRFTHPHLLLNSTGLVVAGYGESQIFPAYIQADVYGHVGSTLYFSESKRFEVTHTGISMIQPLAQTSMIDVFTDGFGSSLRGIIELANRDALAGVFTELSAAGISVPAGLQSTVTDQLHTAFMTKWTKENWKVNYNPLIDVIATLNVEEMAHLAETLLVLESLKERVTSPSESVGGPIDVAVITKGEGLVWIKRKHYFDSSINLRYAARLRNTLAN